MLKGWIKLHRRLLDHWSASEPEMLAAWVRLLLEANHQDTKKTFNGSLIEIKRGQLIFGYNAFSAKSGVSKKKLERYMKLFEAEGMLGRQRGNKYSLITIACYDSYQEEGGKGEAEGKQRGGKGEHRKNVKNVENVKNIFDAKRIIPIWNSLGCKQHKGLTQSASNSLAKTYAHYCKESESPKELNDWLEAYLKNGFKRYMTDHHRQLDDGQWSADLEFAVRFSTYDKIRNTKL
jgi:hypothetical protein